ncbi:MAG: hypothetical protein ABII90_02200 [Bacteroidota bacterium]
MKIKRLYFILLIILLSLNLQAGNDNYGIGARSAGMGNASVTISDLWSVHHNQAGLARLENISAGIYYENRFAVSELSLKGVAVAIPVPGAADGVFGVSMSYFGYSKYNDCKIGLAYAKSFGDKFSAGIMLDYLSTRIGEDYGKKMNVAVEIGIQAQLIKNLSVGAHIFNPTRSKIAEFEIQGTPEVERIPTIMRFGLNYTFSDKVFVSLETEKDIDYKPVFKAGLEYHIIKELFLRTGISTNPTFNTFGFGLNLKQFTFDFAVSIHQVLGYTPHLSLAYKLK